MEGSTTGVYEVDGTPTDCVNIAITQLTSSTARMPDLVVSGINKGYNLGDDVTYSGTVAGALEGALLGIPRHRRLAGAHARHLRLQPRRRGRGAGRRRSCLRHGLPPRTFLNINVPPGRRRAFALTSRRKRNHVTVVDERIDPRGKPYYWIEEGQNDWEPHDRSDYQAVKDGYVSVTPLQPDLTAYDELDALARLLGSGRES